MEQYCKNHTFSDAHWYCKKCDSSYCFTCIDKKTFDFSKEETFVHVCPECKRMVEWTGINHIRDPFMKSLGKAFMYPASPVALMVIAALSFLGLFLSTNIVFNEIIFTLIWITLISYSSNVTDKTIKGKNTPPKFNSIHMNDLTNHIFMIFKQSLFYLIFCTGFVFLSNAEHTMIKLIFLAVSSLMLPFTIIKSMTAGNIKTFFDPLSFFKVLKKSGFEYLVIAALFIPVISIFYLMMNYNIKIIIPFLCFLTIAIYRLLGQLIMKCHKELNYSLNYENFKNMYTLETLHGFKT